MLVKKPDFFYAWPNHVYIFFLSKRLLQCTNNLQLTKFNQNNMIKMPQSLKSHFDFFH